MILTSDISDHLPCLTILNGTNKVTEGPTTVELRKLDEHNIVRISNSLKHIDWSNLENLKGQMSPK